MSSRPCSSGCAAAASRSRALPLPTSLFSPTVRSGGAWKSPRGRACPSRCRVSPTTSFPVARWPIRCRASPVMTYSPAVAVTTRSTVARGLTGCLAATVAICSPGMPAMTSSTAATAPTSYSVAAGTTRCAPAPTIPWTVAPGAIATRLPVAHRPCASALVRAPTRSPGTSLRAEERA